jgi:hypothetical protein
MRFALLLVAAMAWAQPASVTGRAVNASTGAPLKNAQVWLEVFTRIRRGNELPSVPVVATDADGRFTITNVPPGQYLLFARRGGYLKDGGQTPFALAPRETRRDVVVQLAPQSLIAGRVVDEGGEAVPGAKVSVRRFAWIAGRRQLAEVCSCEAQADGSFVVGKLSPRRYYLSASHADPAIPVDVTAGSEVRGIVLRARSLRGFRVRGRVVNAATGEPAGNLLVRYGAAPPASANALGEFVFDSVLPGTYSLETDHPAFFASASFTVTSADLDDVVLRGGKGAEITVAGAAGQVALEGTDGRVRWNRVPRWSNLPPGRYLVHVNSRDPEAYVKSMDFDGVRAPDHTIALTSGATGELRIELAHGAGQILGAVATPGAVVQLWPTGGAPARALRADARGEFVFDLVPPGDYRVIAFPYSAEALDFPFHFGSEGAKVHVAERGRERVEPKWIDRDRLEAELDRLQ